MKRTKNVERRTKNSSVKPRTSQEESILYHNTSISRVAPWNNFLVGGVAVILALIPFHAFLTVWAASIAGHYTAWRLWKEFLLLSLFVLAVWAAWQNKKLRGEIRKSWLFGLIAAYVILQFLLGLAASKRHDVTFAALAEGWIENTRFLVFFFVAWTVASCSPWLRRHWLKLILFPAGIVVAFGLLQEFVLPANFLSHFGYGPMTIKPFELVDQNPEFLRAQSTLRGADPLGAYLVTVLAVLVSVVLASRLTRPKGEKSNLAPEVPALLVGSAVLLFFTYSRSAFFGAVLAVFIVIWMSLKNKSLKRWLLIAAAAACLVFGVSVIALRHNARFENIFFHTSQNSNSAQSSNQNHASALKSGLSDVLREPLGRGPGSAGPASAHNNHPARISENYFLQIGQETGWPGIVLFVVINFLLAKALWKRRGESDHLPLILFASLIALSFVNLLSHAWADDTLAYVFWGLSGIALAARN